MRRALGIAAGVVALAGGAAPARATTTSSVATAVPADRVADAIGVTTHVMYGDSAYADLGRTIAALRWLGVRHVRDGIRAPDDPAWAPAQRRRLSALAKAGMRLNLVATRADDRLGTPQDLVALLAGQPGLVSIEGANEWDLRGGGGWVDALRNHQRTLYAAVRADPRLAGIPILAPSLGRPKRHALLGDLSDVADYANIHPYTGGGRPEAVEETGASGLDLWEDGAATVAPGKPVISTESGYHNARRDPSGQPRVSEEVAAVYILRTLLEHIRRGYARTYIYELVDAYRDRFGIRADANFGLFAHDFEPKPAAHAVRNLLGLLDDPAGSPTGARLGVQVRGPEDLRSLVLARSGGRYLVVLWRTASIWDRQAGEPRAVADEPVTVDVDRAFAAARVSQPATVADVVATRLDVRTTDLQLAGEPVVIEYAPTLQGVVVDRRLSTVLVRTGPLLRWPGSPAALGA